MILIAYSCRSTWNQGQDHVAMGPQQQDEPDETIETHIAEELKADKIRRSTSREQLHLPSPRLPKEEFVATGRIY